MKQEDESLFVLLSSKSDDVPDLKISKGDTMIIGRNPIAQIKNIKCPRQLYQIELRAEISNWFVHLTNLKTNETSIVKDGETISGPGFEYQVKFEKVSFPSSSEQQQQSTASSSSPNNNNNNLIKGEISCVRKSCDEDSPNSLKQVPTKKLKVESSQQLKQQPLLLPSSPAVDKFKKMAESLKLPSHWEEVDEGSVQIYHYLGGGRPSSKIIAFDFDGTLVSVKSGSKFPKNGNDWKLWDKNLPNLISKYSNGTEEGHRFVIFSNQKGVSAGIMPLEDVQQRIESCLSAIGVPCIAFCALKDNIYRKPRPGMWYLLQNCYNDLIEIDREESFYIGDAAGRKSALNKDHSCADILFAINNEIPFLTPEQFRVGKRASKMAVNPGSSLYNLPAFNPKTLKTLKVPFASEIDPNGRESNKFTDCDQLLNSINQSSSHCIIFIGLPGAGKSTFFSDNLSSKGYHRINRDELGTMEKCTKEFEKYVKSVNPNEAKLVIDNINVDVASRSPWLSLCSKHNLNPIAFQFNISREHAIHNNNYRRLLNQTTPNSTSPSVPEWLISKHAKNLAPATVKEGFSSIYKINFSPNFGDREPREIDLYYMYLNEK